MTVDYTPPQARVIAWFTEQGFDVKRTSGDDQVVLACDPWRMVLTARLAHEAIVQRFGKAHDFNVRGEFYPHVDYEGARVVVSGPFHTFDSAE